MSGVSSEISIPAGIATESTLANIKTDTGDILTELKLKADLTETQPVSAAALPLPSGASTSAKQDLLLTELQLKADLSETQPVSVAALPLPSGASTSAKQDLLLTELQLKADLSETQPVSVAALPLPSGAATSAKQDLLLTELQLKADLSETQPVSMTTLPAGTNNIGDVDVLTLPALPVGTNTIGNVNLNTLSVVDQIDTTPCLDLASTNMPGSGSNPATLVASLAAAVKKVQALDTSGAYWGVYSGAALSEVLLFVVGPGSDSIVEQAIPAGTRISFKRLDSASAAAEGNVALNFIG